MILLFRPSLCMEKLGPNDLYAWQIFETQNPHEIIAIYIGLSILLGYEPESIKIFQVINEALEASIKPYKIIKNSKPIFDKYIKPALSKIKINYQPTHEEEIPESVDLYSWQIFETQNPNEIKKIYLKLARQFHPDRYKGPDADKIFSVISAAYDAQNLPTGFENTIIKGAKPIFTKYIKPYLSKLKIEPKLKELTTQIDQLKENFSLIKHTPIIELTNIIPTINKLEKFIHEVNQIKSKITEINKNAPEEAQKIEKELNIIKGEASARIKQLQPAIKVEKAFLYIQYVEELLKGNPEIKREIRSLAKVIIQPSTYSEPIKGSQFKSFVQELREMGAITDTGEIKSLEKIYIEILKRLNNIKKDNYLKSNEPQAQSLLKEIQNLESYYNAQLMPKDTGQILANLSSTLKSLANISR